MKKILSLILATIFVLCIFPLTASADSFGIDDVWHTYGAKYSSSSLKVIFNKEKTATKSEGFTYKYNTETGAIDVHMASAQEMSGVSACAAISSKVATSLSGLEVTVVPGENYSSDTYGTTDDMQGPSFTMLWTTDEVTQFADKDTQSLMYYRDNTFDGLRALVQDGIKAMGVYLMNNWTAYNGTKLMSTVAVMYFDGSFSDITGENGYRWWFRARNNHDQTTWADSSGIAQSYQCIDTANGFTISVRDDTTYGYVVQINGKDYCDVNTVAYFPANTKIIEVDGGQNDYLDNAPSWLNSYTYARLAINMSDLSQYSGGYLTVGACANAKAGSEFDFSVTEINGMKATEWNGQSSGSHAHHDADDEWVTLKEADCKTMGVRQKYCDDCGAVIAQEYIPINENAHKAGEWTHLNSGKDVKYCKYHTSVVVEERSNPYKDLSPTAWYTTAALYNADKGYMTGTTGTTFAPNTNLTRAQIVQILSKMSGDDITAYEDTGTFTDLTQSWYKKAVYWAQDKGIANGTGNGKFSPAKSLSRQELALMLMKYAQYKGKNTDGRADLSSYTDKSSVASWAKNAIEWAVNEGLISGTGNGTTISPTGIATRAQAAVIVMNFDKK